MNIHSTYGDNEQKYDDNNFEYKPSTKNDTIHDDYTRKNTNLIRQMTEQSKNKSCFEHIKDIKNFCGNWKKQYHGLSFSESIKKFIYNLSHFGVTIGTIIYCIIFIIIIGSTIWSNYIKYNELKIEFIIIFINCIFGIIGLLLNILSLILLFDFILNCIGIGYALNASWKINDGLNKNGYNSQLVIFGLAMILIIPFRIFWWHKYYPNKFIAIELYTKLSKQGLLQQTNS